MTVRKGTGGEIVAVGPGCATGARTRGVMRVSLAAASAVRRVVLEASSPLGAVAGLKLIASEVGAVEVALVPWQP